MYAVQDRAIQPQCTTAGWYSTRRHIEKMSDYKQSLTYDKRDGDQTYSTFNGEDHRYEERGFKVTDAIEKLGFGRFQVFMGLVSGAAWIADGMEILVISILGPVLRCEWDIDVYQEAMLTTVVFWGLLVGSPVFGWCADMFGRRNVLTLSSLWLSIFGLLSASASNIYWIYAFRLLVGIGIGGCPQVVTYFAEFLPNTYRGRCLILPSVFFAIGGTFCATLAIFILLPHGWRWWLGVCSIPSIIFFVFSVVFGNCLEWVPRSPHFDLISSNGINAEKTLRLIALCNKGELPEGRLVPEPPVARGRISDLCKPGFRLTSCLLTASWFFIGFSYYGTILLTTELIAAGSTCKPDILGDRGNHTCEVLERTDYVNILITSVAELPALFVTALLIDKIGRKPILIIGNLSYGVIFLLLFNCMGKTIMVIILFTLRFIVVSCFQSLYVYTPEFYPTKVRALSVGLGSMFCRMGTMLVPYVSVVLVCKSL